MPLSIDANLRWVRSFLADEWQLVLPVALAFLAFPPLALGLALPLRITTMPQTIADLQAIGASMPGWLGPVALAGMLITIVGALAIMALALIPRISVREAILVAARRAPHWIGAAILIMATVFVALIAIGTALMLAGLNQSVVMAAILIALIVASLFLVLLMPLAVDRRIGPISVIREGWHLYRRGFARRAGACAIVWSATWITSFAIQVAAGSLILMAGLATGQPEMARAFAAVLSSVLGALQWAFFYVFVAALYRSGAGPISAI